MPWEDLRELIAPCGLRCDTCLVRRNGRIQTSAAALRERMGGFMACHERFAGMEPVFAEYPAFERVLDLLARGSCAGCRHGGCLFKGCPVQSCAMEKGVVFCFQCDRFPCDRLDTLPFLKERWQRANETMSRIGPEAYFERIRLLPRY